MVQSIRDSTKGQTRALSRPCFTRRSVTPRKNDSTGTVITDVPTGPISINPVNSTMAPPALTSGAWVR